MFREPKRLSEEGQKLGAGISAARELLPSEDRLAALAARLTAAGARVEGAAPCATEPPLSSARPSSSWRLAGRKLVEPGTLAILLALVAGVAIIGGAVRLRQADEPTLASPVHAPEPNATVPAPALAEPDVPRDGTVPPRRLEHDASRDGVVRSAEPPSARGPEQPSAAEPARETPPSTNVAPNLSPTPSPVPPAPTPAERETTAPGPRSRDVQRSAGENTGAPLSEGTVVETEIELLKQARSALAPDPLQAFALTERCRAQYPNGTFAQEREYIAITALARLGRTSDAQGRASLFRRRYPSSAYLPRLARLLGEE